MKEQTDMKLSQILTQGRVTVSCELFPPKTGAALEKVEDVLRDTAALAPDFISVTYGAGGSTSKRTLELAARLQDIYRVPALAHLTCVSSTRDQVADMVARLQTAGIQNILALRGDVPQESAFPSPEHYHYANELIAHIRSLPGGGDLCIGAACYPEGHVECLFRALDRGITVPIVAGIMPVITVQQIRRSCELSGTVMPPRLQGIADRFGDDPAAMRQAGIAYATEQILDLIAHGVEHIHIYTMNKPDVAAKIMDNLSCILRPHG